MRTSPPIGRNKPLPMPRQRGGEFIAEPLFQGPQKGGPDQRIVLGLDAISDVTPRKIATIGTIASKSRRPFTTVARADISFHPCLFMSPQNSAWVSGTISKRRP